jgi:hypothetical protein
MATKIYRVCDNCKHETKVSDPEEMPKAWWEGPLPIDIKAVKKGHPALLCDGCVEAQRSALMSRVRGTQARDVGGALPS